MSEQLVDFLESVLFSPKKDEKKLGVFMMTYKKYCTIDELFELLEQKYNEFAPKENLIKDFSVKERFSTFYKVWIDQCSKDMSSSMKQNLLTLLRPRMIPEDYVLVKDALQSEKPKRKLRSLVKAFKNKATDQPAEELAKQLSLVQWSLFSRFNANEMSKVHLLQDSEVSSLLPMKDYFNKISFWAATQILLAGSTKKQTAMVEYFAKVLQYLVKMSNFEGVMEILSALNMAPVRRIEKIWKKVSSTANETISNADRLMSAEHNFQEYRNVLKNRISSQTPCIPWMALILKDLIFIAEGNKDGVELNLEKLELEGYQMLNVIDLQKKEYPFQKDELLYKFLENIAPTEYLEEDDLFQISYQYQPSKLENLSSTSFETNSDDESTDSFTETESISDLSVKSFGNISEVLSAQKSSFEYSADDVRIKCEYKGSVKLIGTMGEIVALSDLERRITSKLNLSGDIIIEFNTPNKDRIYLRSAWHFQIMKTFIKHYEMTSIKLAIFMPENAQPITELAAQ